MKIFTDTKKWMVRILPVVALLVLSGNCLHAQTDAKSQTPPAESPDALFSTIQALDTQLFDAYNHCDLEKFGSFLAEDLEFYHDRGGLSRGRAATVEAVKKNICGKATRELVPGTLEVYPIANYGAIEVGVHRFHHPGHDDTEPLGEAKFLHIWQYSGGTWKITRVVSYDHHTLAK
ncbi:nuclear transport factor 2 family protein [Silvibacterium sp.]|uniref:nuclear transport factor 2 family protein n=1 Tax=Silvibacterium sp. TaxID=1964179 RepID=UPI0039E4C3BD